MAFLASANNLDACNSSVMTDIPALWVNGRGITSFPDKSGHCEIQIQPRPKPGQYPWAGPCRSPGSLPRQLAEAGRRADFSLALDRASRFAGIRRILRTGPVNV